MEGRGTEGRSVQVDLLAHLRMALGQLRLYPVKSPQAMKSITVAHGSLTSSLAGQGKLTISRTLRGLLINGKRLPAAGETAATIEKAWLQILQDAQVNSISLRPPLGLEELATFLDALAKKFWDLKDGKAINQRLREAKVQQAWVEEIQFVAVGAGDLVIEGAAAKLEASGARVSEIVSTLEQVIDGTTSEGLAEQVRLEIMRKLLDHDPLLIEKARAVGYGKGLAAPAAPGAAEEGSSRGPGWIPFEQACRSLADIARLLKTATPELRDDLRALGHRIIGGFRYDPLLTTLLKKFLTDEAVELIPTWMNEEEKKEAEVPAPVRHAAEIFALEEERQLAVLSERAAPLLKELVELKRLDLVGEIVKVLTEQARHVDSSRRLRAAQTLLQVFPDLRADELQETRVGVEARVLAALNLERDPAIFAKLADLAVQVVDARLLRGDLEPALPFLEAIRKHVHDPEGGDRSEAAHAALERVAAGRASPILLEKLGARDPLAARLAEALDAAAARLLIEQLRSADGVAARLEIAQFLLKAGPRAGNILAEEAQRVLAPSEALKMVEIIPSAMADAQAESALGALLRHPALAVRRRAASLLAGRAYPRSGSFLLDALRDEGDPSARALFVEALRQLRHEPAIATLGQIVDARTETDEVRAAACGALGNMGKPQVIPILTRTCVKARGLTKVIGSVGPVVRAAAARALAGYTQHAECREALRRALDEKEGIVRDAAQEALLTPLVKAFGEDVRRARVIAAIGEADAHSGPFAGFLSEVSLDQVFQFLEERRKGGAVFLSVGGMIAQIYLDRGTVVAAEYDGRRDEEAFQQFCRWEGTAFHYVPDAAAPRRGPARGLIKLLMDACEVQDRPERVRTQP